jgi:hypothetical protein
MQYVNNQKDLFYSIDHPLFVGKRFYSKVEALDAAKGLPDVKLKFNWFPSLWERYDYTKVSLKSYDQLKLERALKIREKYKYLKLYFSGGSDSVTMLNTFISNGIHIDEIVNWQKSLNRFDKIDPDIENDLSAIPYLKSIQHLIPKTKITIDHITLDDIKLYNNSFGKGTEKRRVVFGDPAEIDFIPDHKYLYLKDDRDTVGHIEGGQKPAIFFVNNKWYFGIYDLGSTSFYNNAEDFFLDVENPELYMKTVHTFKNFMDNFLINDYEKFLSLAYDRNKKENRKEIMPIIGRDSVFHDVSLIKFHFTAKLAPVLSYDNKKIKLPYIRTYEIIKSIIDQNLMQDKIRDWNDNVAQLAENYADNIKQDYFKNPHPVIGFKPVLSSLYNLENRNDIITTLDNITHNIVVL